MIYLIRHAEKLNSSVHAKLTRKGLNNSFLYGKKLKENQVKIDLIISSPIERCLQTAQEIAKGYGDIKIEKSTLLGDAGIFVNDGDKAMKIFNQYRLIDIINMQLKKEKLDGFNDINMATKNLLNFMSKQPNNTLYISHDAIITPFVYSILNINKIKEENIVHFLEGYSTEKKEIKEIWKKYKII